jgi:PAS domain S-box-containing protein
VPSQNSKREENFRIILEQTSEGVITTDVDGKITFANKAAATILGYADPGALIGMPMVDRYPHLENRELLIQELKSKGQIPDHETTLKKKDGALVEVLGHVAVKNDDNGNFTGSIGLFSDITERKRIEEELRLQSEVTSHLSEGIYLIRASDVAIVYTNPRFEQMFGYGLGEMIGKHASIVNAPTDMDPQKTAVEITKVIRKTGAWRGEIENIKKDGTPFWCYASVSLFDHPQYGQVMVAAHTDITERKRVEQELKERTDFLDTITESSALSMWISDNKGTAIRANAACLKFFGATREEVIGKYNLLKDAVIQKQGFMPIIKDVFEKGEAASIMIDYDFSAVDHVDVKAATHKIIKSVFTPVLDSSGKVSNVIVQSIDLTDIKLAEEALRDSEGKYRTLFETMVQGVVYQDVSGNIISANLAAERILGLSIDQMQGRTSMDPRWRAIHEDGIDFLGETHPAIVALNTGKKIKNTIMGVFNPHDSQMHWINVNAVPQFKPGDKKPYQVYTTFEDITERKRAEEELKKSNAMLSTAQRVGNVGSWEYDIVANTPYWSDEIYRIFGLVPQEIKATFEAFGDHIHPDDREMVIKAYNNSVKTKIPYNIEHRLMHKDGTIKHVNERCETYYDSQGKPVRSIGFIQDITERKRAEQEISDLARFPSQNPNPVLRVKKDGTIVYANDASTLLLEHWGTQLNKSLPQNWQKMALKSLKSGTPVIADVEYNNKVFSLTLSPVSDRAQVNIYALDITDRRRAKEKLQQYSENLKDMVEQGTRDLTEAREKLVRSEKLSLLGQFATGIAHDLKNPLNIINNAAYVLKLGSSGKSERDLRSIRILGEEVKRANSIIEGLLDFYRTAEIDLKEMDIGKIIEELVNRISFAEDVEVVIELDKPINVLVDLKQVTRVFQNIMDNAVQSMPKGGTLKVCSANMKEFVQIEFSDTGTGISEENLDKVFEPLFTTRKLAGGTGLGLVICKSIVEAHNGTLTVSSKFGKGTVFTVKLPFA